MPFIVFSGLPGSGKSTVARAVAPRLHLPLLDKDDFLEALFEERGSGDTAWRAALSREADERLEAAARAVPGACLVSWWRHPRGAPTTGTATNWLAELRGPIIEVYCRCQLETAISRFLRRSRHPGHLDALRSVESLRGQLAPFADVGPLGCGAVIELDTEQPVSIDALLRQLEQAGFGGTLADS